MIFEDMATCNLSWARFDFVRRLQDVRIGVDDAWVLVAFGGAFLAFVRYDVR